MIEKEVIIEAIIEKEVEVIVEKIVEVPVEKIVEVEVEVLIEVPVYVEKIVEEDVIVETQMDNFATQQGYDMSSIDIDDHKFT